MYYLGDRLMVEAWFATTRAGQTARKLVLEGVLECVSTLADDCAWETRSGVRHITSTALLAVDIVSVGKNRDAVVLSAW